jgi:cytochrome c oxidase subunit II
MKKTAKRSTIMSILSASLVTLSMFLSLSKPVRSQNQDVQVIEISAKKYEYSNSPIHVKVGSKVQLKITATDHDHGFKIATVPDGAQPQDAAGLIFTSAQDCWLLKKGETTAIEFLAKMPGTYTFRCCHTCGFGHKGMKAQIIVE